MTIRLRRYSLPFVACAAAVALAACSAPSTEPINGIGSGDSLPPNAIIVPENPVVAPTPSPAPNEVTIPTVQDGEIDGMPSAINPDEVDTTGADIPGFSSEELQSAAAWAAAFTQTRYTRSGQWEPPVNRADFTNPVTFYVYASQMTPETQNDVLEWTLTPEDVEKNRDVLEQLVPLAPEVSGQWMLPAVGNFVFGMPKFVATADAKSVAVVVPYAAYAVYGDKKKDEYYAIEIRDTATYTLTLTKDGWRLAAWTSDPQYGAAERLEAAPLDRLFGDYSLAEEVGQPADTAR